MAALKLAEVLAFERKLSNSDGLMYSGLWQDKNNPNAWQPITLQEKSVRGTISNRAKPAIANDELKLNNEVEKANLQTVDVAQLPLEHDTLKLVYSLRVLGDISQPTSCNKPDYQEALQAVINRYLETHGCKELARRYAINLVNGRVLWRNRIGVENIHVKITNQDLKSSEQITTEFTASDFPLRDFETNNADIEPIADQIEAALLNQKTAFFRIETFALMGAGQEVFPSQELILDKGSSKKSKTLYHVKNVAGMHSQKIGNALRTIDTWYDNAETFGPIAAEPFGAVTSRGVAYRQPKQKKDFYSLLDAWVLKDKEPDVEQQHYVMSVIIRGGVFGGKD
ncbi:MAG: type I-F CRISPR-associated protein Csy3 [Pseudomonadota bacterium]